MNRLSPRKLRHGRRGVATVEFALLLPFLCFAFVLTLDFCRIFYYALIVSNCARNGAIYGSADTEHAQDTSGILAATRADAGDLNLEQLQIASSTNGANPPTYVKVTVSYPFTTITQYPGIPRQTYLNRTVGASVLPTTPNFN
jgi:Flp pilus assembly protein TadG